MTSWHSTEGAPIPLGVTWIEEQQAYNFAVYSKHAESVALLFFGAKTKSGRCSHTNWITCTTNRGESGIAA